MILVVVPMVIVIGTGLAWQMAAGRLWLFQMAIMLVQTMTVIMLFNWEAPAKRLMVIVAGGACTVALQDASHEHSPGRQSRSIAPAAQMAETMKR